MVNLDYDPGRTRTRAHLWRIGGCVLGLAMAIWKEPLASLVMLEWFDESFVSLVAGMLVGAVAYRRPGDTAMWTR